jgi:hypothetical protein
VSAWSNGTGSNRKSAIEINRIRYTANMPQLEEDASSGIVNGARANWINDFPGY